MGCILPFRYCVREARKGIRRLSRNKAARACPVPIVWDGGKLDVLSITQKSAASKGIIQNKFQTLTHLSPSPETL